MTVARRRGGDKHWLEHFGWSRTDYMLADLFDAMQLNTQATGQWKKKAPDLPEYPRPKIEKRTKPVTVAELHAAWMGKVSRDQGNATVL